MNPHTLSTIFRFERRWIYDDYDDIEYKRVYIFLRDITSPLWHSHDTSSLQYAAFLYSLKSVAIEFLVPEDESGRSSLEGFSDQVLDRFRDLTTEQIIELWQNIFWSQLKFNSEKEEYFGTLGRTISDTMLDDVLSICGESLRTGVREDSTLS
jgi:hypothetical protein